MVRAIFLIAVLAACGKSGGGAGSGSAAPTASSGSAAAPTAPGEITGEWSGPWKRIGMAGGGELHLSVGAKTTFKRGGTLCPPEETPATVTVTGDTVKIEVSTEEVKATYTGKLSGKEITGDLITTCKLGTGTGTFKMTQQ